MRILIDKFISIKSASAIVLLFCTGYVTAQDVKTDQSKGTGFYYGFGLGAFKANNASASFYLDRISDPNSYEQQLWNQNFIDSINNRLNNVLVVNPDGSPYAQFPYPIKYKVTVAGTLMGGYDFGKGLSLIGNLTYTRLKANSFFKLFVEYQPEKTSTDNSVKCIVSGEESRVQIDLGAHQSFIRPKGVRPFIEGGACLTVTEVTKHVMVIDGYQIPFTYAEGTTSNQVTTGNTTSTTTNAVKPGGASPGVFISAGIDFPYKDKFKGSIGGGTAIYRVPLKEGSDYLSHFNLFFRVLVL